jgi:pseudouridine-5'-phosphate glycosidase
MRFGVRSKAVDNLDDVKTGLITTRRIIFTPNVEVTAELKNTAIQITCLDEDGNVLKRKGLQRSYESDLLEGVHGKAATPYLLAKVKELTGGESLESNIHLVFNNAALAAKTAAAYAKL